MSNEQTKQIWQSGGIITAFFGLLFGLLEFFGVFVDPEIQAVITSEETIDKIVTAEQAKGLITVAMSIAFAYFRIRARRVISGGLDSAGKPFKWIGDLFKKKKDANIDEN
jgi:hypothetical protein